MCKAPLNDAYSDPYLVGMVRIRAHIDAVEYRFSSEKFSVGNFENPSGGILLAPLKKYYIIDIDNSYQS